MKVEIDATIELEFPEGTDPSALVKWWIGAIGSLAGAETYCVGWQVGWERVESYP